MYSDEIGKVAVSAREKSDFLNKDLLKYIVLAMMSGFFIIIGKFEKNCQIIGDKLYWESTWLRSLIFSLCAEQSIDWNLRHLYCKYGTV